VTRGRPLLCAIAPMFQPVAGDAHTFAKTFAGMLGEPAQAGRADAVDRKGNETAARM